MRGQYADEGGENRAAQIRADFGGRVSYQEALALIVTGKDRQEAERRFLKGGIDDLK